MLILYTTYFSCGDKERQSEIDYCIEKNINSGFFDKIVIFIDDGSNVPWANEFVNVVRIKNRVTYKNWIEESGNHPPHYSIFCNSDIYFNESICKTKEYIKSCSDFMALSRWERQGNNETLHLNPKWSQDVWAFYSNGQISRHHARELDFPVGVPRCDNKIAYVFSMRGWRLYNPCSEIRTFHVHGSQKRDYSKRLDATLIGGVAYVLPNKGIEPSLLEIDVWGLDVSFISKVEFNPTLGRWYQEAGVEPVSSEKIAQQPANSGWPTTKPTRREEEKLYPSNARTGSGMNDCVADSLTRLSVLNEGTRLCNYSLGYEIWKHDDCLLVQWGYSAKSPQLLSEAEWGKHPELDLLAIPPVVTAHGKSITTVPKSQSDVDFWQYPCSTELQAFENHLELKAGSNIDFNNKIVRTYIPIPWATYIDKKEVSKKLLSKARVHVDILNSIASRFDFQLRIHTVCQHIHWRRILETVKGIGVTDFHVSHNERDAQAGIAAQGHDLTLHSWPLIAPNIEVPSRRNGLVAGIPVENRKYLASFIGAHMKHYRSDIRKRLARLNDDDIDNGKLFVRVNDEWHFEKKVYKEQVAGVALSETELRQQDDATSEYNEVLSQSIFSLCPEGAGPNTLRFWESLAVGSVPVLFDSKWDMPVIDGFDYDEFCVFVKAEDITVLPAILEKYSIHSLRSMQKISIMAYDVAKKMRCFANN